MPVYYVPSHPHRGFSLVELSIVLVILGLLVGGILAGRSLIRASELRSIGTDISQYRTATLAFRDKYFAIPGDFNQATRFWGHNTAATTCPNLTGAADTGAQGVCDGDMDRILYAASGGSRANERVQFWAHLSRAGLVGGNYTGLAGPLNHAHALLGENVPKGKISNTGWWGTSSSGTVGNLPLLLVLGAIDAPSGGIGAGFLTPAEMWSIDSKLDDGKPTLGRIRARHIPVCTTGSSDTDITALYALDASSPACALHALFE